MKLHRRTFLLSAVMSTPAMAHSFRIGEISIGHAWALPTRQIDGQVFMPLINNATTADALIAARSDLCSLIELRTNNRYDDPAATAFDLEPGKPLPMRPTARHLRLVGLSRPLLSGETFPLILAFEGAGEVEVSVRVEKKPGD